MDQNLPATQKKQDGLSVLLNQESIRNRFEQVLGKKAPGFISSIISAVNSNYKLKTADPMSIVSSAAIAASLDLPINPSLGFAYIIPYKDKATFQMGWKGFVQLGMRSGQYKAINVCEVYEGELVESNRFTGEMNFDEKKRLSKKVIGYVAYFKLMSGFEKYLYMTTEQTADHGKRYSQSFNHKDGMWQTDFDTMSRKTVLKMLLSKFGILSIEMQTALQSDQSIPGQGITDDQDDPAAKIQAFDKSIPANINMEILNIFLTRSAEIEGTTIDGIKIASREKSAEFWKIYRAFEKVEKAQRAQLAKEGKPRELEMAPDFCPESKENKYSKEHCDKCASRQMCRIWA